MQITSMSTLESINVHQKIHYLSPYNTSCDLFLPLQKQSCSDMRSEILYPLHCSIPQKQSFEFHSFSLMNHCTVVQSLEAWE